MQLLNLESNKTKLDRSLVFPVILLMALGTVFVFSASANVSATLDWTRPYASTSIRQLLLFPVAIAIMYLVSIFDYRILRLKNHWYKSPSVYLLAVTIALLIAVLIPGIGTAVNNARRWLRIPLGPFSLSFQPSELAKWSMVIFLAGLLDKFNHDIQLYWKRFVPLCAVFAVIAGLIITQDLGTAAFLALVASLLLLIGGAKLWHFLTPLPFLACAFIAVLLRSPGRMQRIKAFLDPESLASSSAYQANQSLIAIGSGGIFGKGLGRGICKYGHLPEDTTDFIFAVIAEEFGLLGSLAVILLFIVFVWIGLLIVIRCKDRFGQVLAGGIVLTIGIQAILNLGVVTVLLPTKGIPLPFVSAGGTSMFLSAAAVGVLLNIAKTCNYNELAEVIDG